MTHLWVPQPGDRIGSVSIGGSGQVGSGVHGATPVGGGSSGGGDSGGSGSHAATPAGGSSGGGGGGDGAALLVLAVVAAVALPIVVYAVDEPAQPDVVQCWETPEERLAFYGGVTSGVGLTSLVGGRGLLHWGVVGVDAGLEGTSGRTGQVHGAFLARIPPRQHIEMSLGIGGRRLVDPLGAQSWFEVSLPQRYTPFRWSALEPGVTFDLRPAVLLARGAVDVRLEAAVVFPLGPWASIDLGAQAFTFQGAVRGAAVAGLQLSL